MHTEHPKYRDHHDAPTQPRINLHRRAPAGSPRHPVRAHGTRSVSCRPLASSLPPAPRLTLKQRLQRLFGVN